MQGPTALFAATALYAATEYMILPAFVAHCLDLEWRFVKISICEARKEARDTINLGSVPISSTHRTLCWNFRTIYGV
jgi:hypothetical protein